MARDKEKFELFEMARSELIRSNVDKRHPFRLFTLATTDHKNGNAKIRTVVKRKYLEDKSILFYTDSRSDKILDVKENPSAAALFYHPRKKLQLRIQCQAILKSPNSKLYKEHKKNIQQSPAERDYSSKLPPGSPIQEDIEIEYSGRLNFSLVELQLYEMEVLKLGRKGHSRYRYTRISDQWNAEKLVP